MNKPERITNPNSAAFKRGFRRSYVIGYNVRWYFKAGENATAVVHNLPQRSIYTKD